MMMMMLMIVSKQQYSKTYFCRKSTITILLITPQILHHSHNYWTVLLVPIAPSMRYYERDCTLYCKHRLLQENWWPRLLSSDDDSSCCYCHFSAAVNEQGQSCFGGRRETRHHCYLQVMFFASSIAVQQTQRSPPSSFPLESLCFFPLFPTSFQEDALLVSVAEKKVLAISCCYHWSQRSRYWHPC